MLISPSICRVKTSHSHRPFAKALWSLVSLDPSCSTRNVALLLPLPEPNEQIAFALAKSREAELENAEVEMLRDSERVPGRLSAYPSTDMQVPGKMTRERCDRFCDGSVRR